MITQKALALDCSKAEAEIVQFIRRIVSDAKAEGTVVGLSGGIDSSVVGALCVRALGKARVVGLLLPAGHTPKQDVEDARLLARSWGIKIYQVNIDRTFSALVKSIPLSTRHKIAQANAKARIRMIINYFFANTLGMLVAGTGDKSEDELGYYTKFGDGGVDFLPIAHLYKTQVRELSAHLGLPDRVVRKPASPQLWPGHKATDDLPLDYEKLDLVLYGIFDAKLQPKDVSAQTGVPVPIVEQLLRMHRESTHKRVYPPMLGTW